jgi:thymidine kinase
VAPKKKEKVKPKKKAEVAPKKKEKVKPKKKPELILEKAELMPKKAELTCSVASCGEKVKRSFSSKSVEAAVKKAGLQIEGNPKRIQLCDKHYKAIKKELKKERKRERMRHGLPF